MFSNMKNKIREKTGGELPKFVGNKTKSSYHSRQNSLSSISSVTSDHSFKENTDVNKRRFSDTESVRSIHEDNGVDQTTVYQGPDPTPASKEINGKPENVVDWEKKCHESENRWKEKEKLYVTDLLKQTKELQAALALAEENCRKYEHCQNEKEQLETYQRQELAQIKQLLLEKEEENVNISASLKDALALVESLKQEVNRLRPFEEQVNNCQSTDKYTKREEEFEKLLQECKTLKEYCVELEVSKKQAEERYEAMLHGEKETILALNIEINQLKDDVERLSGALEEEMDSRSKAIFRNAQISQQLQLSDQELKRQQNLNDELSKRVYTLQGMLDLSQKNVEQTQLEDTNIDSVEIELHERIKDLQNEISEKNKSIKILQQKLSDMKKTLQEEIKRCSENSNKANCNDETSCTNDGDDINFVYMKHVLMKFLTSSEYEAQHLTRVVSTLLHLNPEEERLLQETLEWRMSWFNRRPHLRSKKVIK